MSYFLMFFIGGIIWFAYRWTKGFLKYSGDQGFMSAPLASFFENILLRYSFWIYLVILLSWFPVKIAVDALFN